MSSDIKNFNRALSHWDRLQHDQSFSDEHGDVAILCSGYTIELTDDEELEQLYAFEDEAKQIEKALLELHIGAFVLKRFTLSDAIEVIRDPLVAGVITIGNGNLSSVYIADNEDLDWLKVAQESTHLKTGLFMQRHCGTYSRSLNVPMGTFLMSSHANVLAAAGESLPTVLDIRDEYKITRLHREVRLEYGQVQQLFPKRSFGMNPS